MSFKSNDSFVDSDAIIGISVGHSSSGNLHNKILIKFVDEVKEIHLAFHNQFVCSAIVDLGSYIWGVPNIPLSRLKSIAARCLKIVKTQQGQTNLLPYALGYHNIRKFDKEGIYEDYSVNSEYGMTCATFVLTVFNSLGWDLLDWQNWTDREEDVEWFDKLLRILYLGVYRGNITQQHYDNVASERNCPKIRPEEVYSSIYCSKLPMKFGCSSSMGKIVREHCLGLPNSN